MQLISESNTIHSVVSKDSDDTTNTGVSKIKPRDFVTSDHKGSDWLQRITDILSGGQITQGLVFPAGPDQARLPTTAHSKFTQNPAMDKMDVEMVQRKHSTTSNMFEINVDAMHS